VSVATDGDDVRVFDKQQTIAAAALFQFRSELPLYSECLGVTQAAEVADDAATH